MSVTVELYNPKSTPVLIGYIQPASITQTMTAEIPSTPIPVYYDNVGGGYYGSADGDELVIPSTPNPQRWVVGSTVLCGWPFILTAIVVDIDTGQPNMVTKNFLVGPDGTELANTFIDTIDQSTVCSAAPSNELP